MRIWLGSASNWLSFSSQSCHPSLALAKEIGLTTTLLSSRRMQPAQDWLPMSIPQTYLIDISSGEHVAAAVFITHLLSCVSPSLHLLRCNLSIVGSEKPNQSGRASAHTGSAISPGTRNSPAVATSLLKPRKP